MSRNIWGHVCAKLNGPSIDDQRRPIKESVDHPPSLVVEYEAYCKLYGEFEALAAHFSRKTIPIKRQVFDATTKDYQTEYAFPLYCEMETDKDAIDQQEKEDAIHKEQQYLYELWRRLEQKMDELCACDYVHLASPWTRIQQNHYYQGRHYENIDVTNDRYLVPLNQITTGPTVIRSDLTQHHYKNALMEVIRNQ